MAERHQEAHANESGEELELARLLGDYIEWGGYNILSRHFSNLLCMECG